MTLKKQLYIVIIISLSFISGCSILNNSNQDNYVENQQLQNQSEQAIRNYITTTFDTLGVYQEYLFTKRNKYLSSYHKRLNNLYEIKYQFDKDGVLKSDSLNKVNKEIDTLKSFIDRRNFKSWYKIEHDFGFEKNNEILLLRGLFFLTPENEIDSLSITFSSKIADSLHDTYKHFIYRKAYEHHPYYEMSNGEYNFYENFHKELWNRRNIGPTEESNFLDHILILMDQMIKSKEFDSDEITKQQINNYLKSNSLYTETKDEKFDDLYQLEIDENPGTRRKIYEREINFYYLLGEKWIEETLVFQFNEFFEIIN